MAISADGRQAASASTDTKLKLWDLESGAQITTFTCDFPAYCCSFASVRTLVAFDSSGRLHLLSLEL